MARKPRKNVVKDIIDDLLNSEIPEIQNVAKELTEWTKQLEEHSWKLQHYASQIQSLAASEAEISSEASLAELVKDLERTLSQLKERPVEPEARAEEAAPAELQFEEALPEAEAVEEEVAESRELPPEVRVDTYHTPEGFVVRRRRY